MTASLLWERTFDADLAQGRGVDWDCIAVVFCYMGV